MNFAYQGKNPPTKFAAMAQASNATLTNNQDPWLADSGTSNHLTANLGNLSIQLQYKGLEQIIVGNGQTLHINHIGNASISTKYHNFVLKNVLHVPRIVMKLLSVHNFVWIIIVLVILMLMNSKSRMFLRGESSIGA